MSDWIWDTLLTHIIPYLFAICICMTKKYFIAVYYILGNLITGGQIFGNLISECQILEYFITGGQNLETLITRYQNLEILLFTCIAYCIKSRKLLVSISLQF